VREGSTEPRIIEASACGIRERSWWDLIAEIKEYKFFRVKGSLPEVAKREIVAYGWGNVGKPDNYWWAVRIGWRLIKRRFVAVLTYPAHVCSSLVYDCFLYAGVDLLPGQVDVLVTPDDLAYSLLLEEVENS
jgi:hypothetical protein